jgi:mono/diheme cytochrome c family protein
MRSGIRFLAAVAICCAVLALTGGSAIGQGKSGEKLIKRGEYLVIITGCNDCHTPLKMGPKGPEPDMSRMLSGHPQDMTMPPSPVSAPGLWGGAYASSMTAWSGPWGVSFTRNLTPDKETGIGEWTEQNFISTLKTGRRMGKGRELLPPMPVADFKRMTDDDLKAVYAYLKSIPAVKNKVPEPLPPAPMK